MNYKICTKCGKEFSATTEFFHRKKEGKFGLSSWCKECCREYDKQYRIDNRNKNLKYLRQYYIDNRDKELERAKQWYEKNPDKCNAKAAKRRAAKLHATPSWANKRLIDFYYTVASTMADYEVDHEIPLQGKTICGMHIESNLQLLHKSLNQSKSSKYPLSEEEEIKYKGLKLCQI